MGKSKTIKIISYIALLLAVIAVFGLIAHFTGGFTTDFKTFYVTVDGKDVMSSSGGYLVTQNEPMTVDVKYTFEFANDENKGYSVKVVPNTNAGADFYYTVDGETHYFYDEKDLSDGFEIQKGEKSFTIKPNGESLTEVLQSIYRKEVSDCEGYGYNDMFTLVVTSYNGEASIKLNFTIPGSVSGIAKIEKERGTMDAKAENKRYFLMNYKIYRNRFSTDCFSDYFNDLAKETKVGLNDYLEYATEKASVDELKKQNSYFINSLYK